MRDNIFIDTNILVYAFLEHEQVKHEEVVAFLATALGKCVFVSSQVISEVYATLSKYGIRHETIVQYLFELEERMTIADISFQTIKRCLTIKERYGYAYWDCLILASALECGCSIVYSEDMQDTQVIERVLTIRNPLKR